MIKLVSESEAIDFVRAAASDGALPLPVGNGTRCERHGIADAIAKFSLAGSARILAIEPGDQLCEVEAGCAPATLDAALAEHNLSLGARSPSHRIGTLGGLIGAPDVSLLHHAYGPVRDQVLGARWLLSDGSVVQTGARVVKSVAGYDVTRLFIGSRGRLAACLSLVLRARPLPRAPRWFRVSTDGMRSWLRANPAARPPLRCAFQLEGGRDLAWVQTDGVSLPAEMVAEASERPAGDAALDNALTAFEAATHRLCGRPGRAESFRNWRRQAATGDAYDWLTATGSFTPRSERELAALHADSAVRVTPETADLAWIAELASACAPGAPAFGGALA